jgi:hypothetical protein
MHLINPKFSPEFKESMQAIAILEKLKTQWTLLKLLEASLLAFVISIWGMLGLYWLSNWSVGQVGFFGLGIFIVSAGISAELRGIRKLSIQKISRFLNRQQPDLEESTELLLVADQELTFLARLQRNKIAIILPQIEKDIRLPQQLRNLLFLVFFTGLCAFLSWTWGKRNAIELSRQTENTLAQLQTTQSTQSTPLPVGVQTAQVQISAPAYTRLGNTESKNLHIKAPENSLITWKIHFKGEIKQARLVFSDKDTLQLKKQTNGNFQISKVLKTKGFYALQWTDVQGNIQSSDFYTWESTPDEKPKITLKGIEQYTDLQYNPHLAVSIEASLSDDYGLTAAYIIATVSKGSGEAVKFREEKLQFANTFAQGSTVARLTKQFKLSNLGMSPGDELYFYVEAQDNRQPSPQKGRTEVYFIALADTASQTATMELGMGINQMPDYFRSQRQLIIDTEKLIGESVRIPKEQFQSRSNNIGVDQKILRLRYGQFLGEEFESAIGGHNHNHEEEPKKEDKKVKIEGFKLKSNEQHYEGDGHDHNDEGHKKWQEKMSSMRILEKNEHEHNQPSKNTSTLYADVPESVMHIHDIQEEATFMDEALKAQLRVVLNQMWESELRLRTNRPKESLPFQYKALYLLKDIQQKSRVYVERVGFEPPPLEEKGKRLTGDVNKVGNKAQKRTYEVNPTYPNLRQAIAYLEDIRENEAKIKSLDKALLNLAGAELAQIAMEKPGLYLKSLKTLKQLSEGQLNSTEIRRNLPALIQSLWSALPQENPQPQQGTKAQNKLAKLYWRRIGG